MDDEASIASYRRRVAALTAELATVRTELERVRVEHRSTVAALEAQARAGISTELLAVKGQLRMWRERAQVAEARLRETRRTHGTRQGGSPVGQPSGDGGRGARRGT